MIVFTFAPPPAAAPFGASGARSLRSKEGRWGLQAIAEKERRDA